MHRMKLVSLLSVYFPTDKDETIALSRIMEFIKSTTHSFDNFNSHGHITASAWIVDLKHKKVGLIHHKKLDKWLQPGGHSDNSNDTPRQALREAREEFGPTGLTLSSDAVFDIDIHSIPSDTKRGLGEHLHYDVRFLIYGDSTINPVVSDESSDARWVSLDQVYRLNNERGIMRLVEKIRLVIGV